MQQVALEDALQSKIKYYGYKGINLDNIKIEQLKNLRLFLMRNLPSKKYDNVQGQVDNFNTLNLDEVKKLAAEFLNKYFTINDVYSITEKELQEKSSFISCVTNAKEAYDNVNSLLIKKSPIDLDINLVGGHALSGQIVKPLLMIPGYLNESNRKVYFSHIDIGSQLNLLSVGTLVHEIAHAEQEQNIGYSADYLHREIISIFLEKVVAYELDESGRTLEVSERVRNTDLYFRFIEMQTKASRLANNRQIDNLLYIKSILFAEKLFDMYVKERKQKYRDRYFADIQKVFDGKETVEDFISQRGLTLNNSQDISLLQRHF